MSDEYKERILNARPLLNDLYELLKSGKFWLLDGKWREIMAEVCAPERYPNGSPGGDDSVLRALQLGAELTRDNSECERSHATFNEAIEAWNRRPATAQQREGFVLVPVEPTREMIDAGYYAACQEPFSKAAYCYKAMLAAAPTPPPERAP